MNAEALSLLGILVATVFFIFAIFRGYHVTLVSIVGTAIVCAFSRVDIMNMLTTEYMTRFGSAYINYFLLFFFSAFFAKSLGDSGAAQTIAYKLATLARKWPGHEKLMAILALALMQAVFTLGGISLFVVTFTIIYIAKDLFTELNIPWKLYTCASLGSSTFTAGIFPGSPQLTNLIPMDYFGTEATAAPVLSIICSVFCVTLCVMWVVFQVGRTEKANEGFEPSGTALLASWDNSQVAVVKSDMNILLCLTPSIILIVVLNVFKAPAVVALIAGTVTSYLLFNPVEQFKKLKPAAMTAVQNTNQALVALASASGFGGVVASVSGFGYILGALDKVPGPAVFQVIISVNVAAGFTASSSTGLRLALDMLGDKFLSYGIPNQALHRLTSISSLGLDTLPHSSALANTFYMTKLTYKDAYINNFMVSVVITLLTAILAGILISMGLTF